MRDREPKTSACGAGQRRRRPTASSAEEDDVKPLEPPAQGCGRGRSLFGDRSAAFPQPPPSIIGSCQARCGLKCRGRESLKVQIWGTKPTERQNSSSWAGSSPSAPAKARPGCPPGRVTGTNWQTSRAGGDRTTPVHRGEADTDDDHAQRRASLPGRRSRRP
jgi:hypothetical protein